MAACADASAAAAALGAAAAARMPPAGGAARAASLPASRAGTCQLETPSAADAATKGRPLPARTAALRGGDVARPARRGPLPAYRHGRLRRSGPDAPAAPPTRPPCSYSSCALHDAAARAATCCRVTGVHCSSAVGVSGLGAAAGGLPADHACPATPSSSLTSSQEVPDSLLLLRCTSCRSGPRGGCEPAAGCCAAPVWRCAANSAWWMCHLCRGLSSAWPCGSAWCAAAGCRPADWGAAAACPGKNADTAPACRRPAAAWVDAGSRAVLTWRSGTPHPAAAPLLGRAGTMAAAGACCTPVAAAASAGATLVLRCRVRP